LFYNTASVARIEYIVTSRQFHCSLWVAMLSGNNLPVALQHFYNYNVVIVLFYSTISTLTSCDVDFSVNLQSCIKFRIIKPSRCTKFSNLSL